MRHVVVQQGRRPDRDSLVPSARVRELRLRIQRPSSLTRPFRDSFVPLPKSSRPERVLTNSQVYDFELSEEDMAALDALDKGKAGAITWNPVDAP